MKVRVSRLTRLVVAIGFAALVSLSASAADERIQKSFDVKPGGTLTIDTDIGEIEVRARKSATTVTIEVEQDARTSDRSRARKILDDFDIDFRQSGNDVTVTGRYDGPRDRGWSIFDLFGGGDRGRRHLKVEFTITVPERYNVDLRTSGGNIKVNDLDGRADVRTSGGNLELGRIDGPVTGHTSGGNIVVARSVGKTEVRTSGGNITVEESRGPVDARTSGGNITIRSAEGKVYARTSGGSIKAEGALGAIDASTSGGSVIARLTEQPTDSCRLATSGGSVTIYVADGIGFDLDARASGGSVDSDVPVTIDGRLSRDRIEGQVNDGGPTLVVRSSGGGIRLREF